MRLILLLLLVAFISSCETQYRAYRSSNTHYFAGEYSGYDYADKNEGADLKFGRLDVTSTFAQQKSEKSSVDPIPAVTEKKIIYNASLNLNVKKPDSTNKELVKIAERYEGYAQSISTDYTVIR